MKAAGLSHKCTPGRVTVPGAARTALHVPPRRTVAISVRGCRHDEAEPGASAAVTLALDASEPGAAAAMPHVLQIDKDSAAALALSVLLLPEARVTHVPTLAAAREQLRAQMFSAIVLDPDLTDGDAADLLPALAATPLLVYSANRPAWSGRAHVYLPKPWTTPRLLWTTLSRLLGIPTPTSAGD